MSEAKRVHQDVEFVATREGVEAELLTYTWANAVAYLEGHAGMIDVIVWSKEGAQAYGGDDAVDAYMEDEEASVFERYTRKNAGDEWNCEGRVP